MFPVTVVKRFLNRNVPNIPLPSDIDDDLDSNSGSWIVPSKPTSISRSQAGPSTISVACQTSIEKPSLQASPRSRPRDYTTQDVRALPPPKFTLEALMLQCYIHLPHQQQPKGLCQILLYSGSFKLQPNSYHHQPSSIIVLEPHRQPKPRNPWNQTRPKLDRLKEIFYDIGFSSKLFCEIHDSQFADQHIDRIGESLGTGGLLMYLQGWNHWACWCHLHSTIPAEAPLSLILDYLHASDLFKNQEEDDFGAIPNKNVYTYQSSRLEFA